MNNYYLAGTCVNSFDEDGNSLIKCFSDASDFAVKEENASEISEEKFKEYATGWEHLPKGNYTYLYSKESDVLMAYNIDEDVHYFFVNDSMTENTKRKIVRLFLESDNGKRWYHGDTSRRNDFCDQNMQRDLQIQDANANGPGIYFTNDPNEAYGYAYPSGYLYTVDIDTDSGRIIRHDDMSEDNQDILIQLIKIANKIDPEKVYYTISDYMEGAVTEPEDVEEWMFAHVVEKHMSTDYFIEDVALISRDFFDSANNWAKAMVKLGIIGYMPEGYKNNQHFIVYDCNIITIVDEKPFVKEK